MKAMIVAAAVLTILVAAPAAAQSPAADIGKLEYTENCATCHGASGKGDGQLSAILTKRLADLTTISKRNNGVFPFAYVFEIIDGRQAIKGHGTRDMPIWGSAYSREGWAKMYGTGTPEAAVSYIRGKIVALIGYIQSLQK